MFYITNKSFRISAQRAEMQTISIHEHKKLFKRINLCNTNKIYHQTSNISDRNWRYVYTFKAYGFDQLR